MNPRGFASDNYAGVHPLVMDAIAAANADHAPAYGADAWTAGAQEAIRDALGVPDALAFPVFNGTGANNVCLSALCRSWDSVICVASAHINVDESTSPEAVSRVKLQTVAAADGKLTPELAATKVVRIGDEHAAQPRVISITQSTELGTVYTVEEIAALADFAHAHGLYLHVDGARIFNGAVACGATLPQMLRDTGVDVLSLGATKIGALGVEVAVFLKPELGRDVLYIRKQLMQLASKQRFSSAQVSALLQDGLALQLATHANAMAARLADGVRDISGVTLSNTPAANAVFATLDPAHTAQLQEDWRFYVWDEVTGEVRWMCSWDTTEADVDAFVADVRRVVES